MFFPPQFVTGKFSLFFQVLFFFLLVIISDLSPTVDHLPALPVGGTPPGSSGGGAAVGGDRAVVLGGHGGAHVPDAHADHVRKAVFKVQVRPDIPGRPP